MNEEEEEPPFVWHIVTCRHAGCPVNGVEYRVKLYVNADGLFRAVCGQCGEVPEMREDTAA